MSQFFVECYYNFQDNVIDKTKINVNEDYFGIINMTAISCSVIEKELDFIFVIDRSGSMDDKCSDGRSKMQHIIHTLKNMIVYFHENKHCIKTNITVFAFDDYFTKVIERTLVNEETIKNIINKITKIYPTGLTDIEKALTEVGMYIQEIQNDHPNNLINHIFMTDGEVTKGSKNFTKLKNMVNQNVMNAFIGFGIDHDASLMNHISDNKNSSYHFIDAIERSGLVYGEILHGVLYKLLVDVVIYIENGLIYNYKTNKWSNNLFVGDIVGESNKVFHIVSNTPDDCSIQVSYNYMNEPSILEVHKLIPVNNTDYSKYIYRQRTLQMLYDVKEYHALSKKNVNVLDEDDLLDISMDGLNNVLTSTLRSSFDKIKKGLLKLFKEMKEYMTNNELAEDSFMRNLCDDIFITYRTFGSKYGSMYSCARQTSQGTQRCYTVNQTPDDLTCNIYNGRPFIRNRGFLNIDIDNEDDDFTLHEVTSDFTKTPYLSQTATVIMSEISGFDLFENDNDNEDQETQI